MFYLLGEHEVSVASDGSAVRDEVGDYKLQVKIKVTSLNYKITS